jgi:hypothetical protein
VVEHSLGKGEVVSSILTGSTSNSSNLRADVLVRREKLFMLDEARRGIDLDQIAENITTE